MNIGQYNTLTVLRSLPFGMILGNDEGEEVLLPQKYVLDGLDVEDEIEVFVYLDSGGRPVATTLDPKAVLHEFAYLEVKQMSQYGAFMDFGLEKDLMVPFREQERRMITMEWYVVFIYMDKVTNRLVGSSKLDRFFENDHIQLDEGQKVDLMVYKKTDIGMNVIINNLYKGLVHSSDIFQKLKVGDRLPGYIKTIRPDQKIDVVLKKMGWAHMEGSAKHVLEVLAEHDGFLDIHDKSDPEKIQEFMKMSKKTFKKAIGVLYKKGLVRIEPYGIYLVEEGEG